MCGRARCTLTPAQVAMACGINPSDAPSVPTRQMDCYRPSYNVAPGANLPVFVVRREGAESEAAPVIHCMKWGLIPSFSKKTEKPDHYRMFNARSESIRDKASFRRLLPSNRCLVAVEGFYEWRKDGAKKQPYYIHFQDRRPLVFAALYDSWKNSEGEILYTFTILTTESSSALQWLHDRMPVILGNNVSIDLWLNNSSKLETVLQPYEDPDLVWYPVTPAMGKPSFDEPECIKELKSAGEKPLSKFFSKKIDEKCQPEPVSQKRSDEPPQLDVWDRMKEETDAEETEKVTGKEESCKSEEFTLAKKEAAETEDCGIKREYEETATNHGKTSGNMDSRPTSSVKKKKERTLKKTGDRQASLHSYYGKS